MGLSFRSDTLCENNGPLENASSATAKFEKSPASKLKGIYCLAKGEQRNIHYLRKRKDKGQQTELCFSSVSGLQRPDWAALARDWALLCSHTDLCQPAQAWPSPALTTQQFRLGFTGARRHLAHFPVLSASGPADPLISLPAFPPGWNQGHPGAQR